MNSFINNKAIVFNYQQDDYVEWAKNIGEQTNAESLTDGIKYHKDVADGYIIAKIIEPGFSYRIENYTLNTDVYFSRMPAPDFHLMIHFYIINSPEKIYFRTGKTVIEVDEKSYSIALMTNSFTDQNLLLKKGTGIAGLSVQLTEEWLKNNIINFTADKLELVKQKECLVDFISAKQRKILHDLINSSNQSQLPELYIKSRVLRLTEHFLTNLYNRDFSNTPHFTNQKDFQALLNVEKQLQGDGPGGFPSIEKLAKDAFMSESKLKKLFKQAYGMAPYEYFQKNRMHKAKALLQAKKHNITQVGTMLGYQNMSNFSTAFKKEFNFLPSQAHEVL
jgi:AraC-like DNA-binding protein